jgi:hypothetical protein
MNKLLGLLENFGAKGLVLATSLLCFSHATNAGERPLYLTTMPIDNFESTVGSGAILRARDVYAFKAFVENKYQLEGLRADELMAIIQINDLQDYQSLNRESAEIAGKANPTCIC